MIRTIEDGRVSDNSLCQEKNLTHFCRSAILQNHLKMKIIL